MAQEQNFEPSFKQELGEGEGLKNEKTTKGGKTYPITIMGEVVELTLEELLEFAQKCANEQEVLNADIPDLQEFIKQYPDVTEIPDEVAGEIKKGRGMVESYRGFENSRLKKELDSFKKNESNKTKSLGSARGASDGDAEVDELMRVFESVFK